MRSPCAITTGLDGRLSVLWGCLGKPFESSTAIYGSTVDAIKKNLRQFLATTIEVDRWRDIEGERIDHTIGRELGYRSWSLWPRQSTYLEPHPSPITDEYRSSPRESRTLITVRDVGLQLDCRAASRKFAIEVRICTKERRGAFCLVAKAEPNRRLPCLRLWSMDA